MDRARTGTAVETGGVDLDGEVARMFSTVTTVAAPHDVTLEELHVEVFYPADAETEATLAVYERRAAERSGTSGGAA